MTTARLELFAVTAPGLEGLVTEELRTVGIQAEAVPGGAAWSGDLRDVYAANLHLRTASRILVRIANFRARSFIELERHARRIEWGEYLGAGSAAQIRATSRKSKLYHEGAIVERVARWIGEDAGVAAAAAAGDEAEDGVEGGAGQLFVVRMLRDECTISVDASGELLHRRGYRQAVAKAPLRETLAAATLLATGWRGTSPLIDPMCGAGTIPIEAALIARRIPPGLANAGYTARTYSFESWPGYDGSLWERIVAEGRRDILPGSPVVIRGSDRDTGAIEAAVANAERAGVAADITFEVLPLSRIESAGEGGLLVSNPPYGARIGDTSRLRDLYAAIGSVARERLEGWSVALLSADPALERQLRMEMAEMLRTNNGGIPVRVVCSGCATVGAANVP